MSAPPYMPFFVGDYLADTTHLTCTEHGAYMLLLMAMWRAGGELPDDPARLARFARCTGAQWARMSGALLAFFEVRDGVITHGRLKREMGRHAGAVEQRRRAASNGGKARALKTQGKGAPGEGLALRQPEPEPEPREEISEAKASSPSGAGAGREYPDGFEACWKAYPHVKGRCSKPKALMEWRRAGAGEGLLAAVRRYAAEGREPKAECGAPAMERWLRDGRFLDWMAAGPVFAPAAWQGPAELRAAVVAAMGEAWAVSWLDACGWDAGERVLLAPRDLTVSQLERHVRGALGDVRVRVAPVREVAA